MSRTPQPRRAQLSYVASTLGETPHNTWLGTGTPTTDPYPCQCTETKLCTRRCPCNGRTDHDHLPSTCCARRRTEAQRRREAA